MAFQPVDRLPRWEWATWWDKTIARWVNEGLEVGLADAYGISQSLGLDPYRQFWWGAIDTGHEAVSGALSRGVSSHDDYTRILPGRTPLRRSMSWVSGAIYR